MDRTHRFSIYSSLPSRAARMKRGAAALALAFGFVPMGRTDSSLQSAPSGSGPISASAHLDFRITVLPTLALSMQPAGVRVQGSGSVLTVQSNADPAWDGRAPQSSIQLRPQRRMIDASIPVSQFSSGALITIAAP